MNFDDYAYLYVEDDAMSRQIMHAAFSRILRAKQFAIFETSEDFLTHLEALPWIPSIIFLDIHIQPYSGFEMLAMLRQHSTYQNCFVIAITASVMSEEVLQLQQAGFNGAIGKPLDVATFGDLVKRILAGEAVWQIE